MSAIGLLLSILIPVIVITITIFTFRPLLRGYREEVAEERRADENFDRLSDPEHAKTRKARARWFIGIGYLASILWLVFAAMGGPQRDAAGTISVLLLPLALVGINVGWPFAVRAPYAKGQNPSWRRLAMFTLILWAVTLASFGVSGFNVGLSAIVVAIAIVTLPTLLAFPLWLLTAFLKQRRKQAA